MGRGQTQPLSAIHAETCPSLHPGWGAVSCLLGPAPHAQAGMGKLLEVRSRPFGLEWANEVTTAQNPRTPEPQLGVAQLAASKEMIKKSLTCAKGGTITWALAFYEIGKVDFPS